MSDLSDERFPKEARLRKKMVQRDGSKGMGLVKDPLMCGLQNRLEREQELGRSA